MGRIKVLVVDDSLLFQRHLVKGLSEDPWLQVVATAADPFDARDKILKYRPDVMTLDVEMPKMNGIEFLRRLMPQYPLPTIIVSAISESVFEAIQYGAVDFVRKPDGQMFVSNKEFFSDLIYKIKTAATAKVKHLSEKKGVVAAGAPAVPGGVKVIAIGASTGGTVALTQVITGLKPPVPGIVIVQHIPPVFSGMFAQRLDAVSAFRVKEAESGDIVKPGQILIAPGNKHMRVVMAGKELKVERFNGEKVNGHCPSVDVLFDSLVQFGGAAVGVILTGMGYDGAKGLLRMRKAGARTIGQDEASSVVYGMPKVAHNIGGVEIQVPLEQIAAKICSVL